MYRDEWRAIINTQCSSLVRVFELNCSCRQHRVSSYNNLTRVTSCCDMWAWRHHFNWQAYNSNTCFHTIIDCEFTTASCSVSCGLWDFASKAAAAGRCLGGITSVFTPTQRLLQFNKCNYILDRTTQHQDAFSLVKRQQMLIFFWNTNMIVHLLNYASHTHT